MLISAVPPNAAHYAGYLARRVHREVPRAKIAVGVWAGADDVGASRERLLKPGHPRAATQPAVKFERPRRSAPR